MKVCAIIAEYNPFHCGHEYQIQQARKQTNADYVIVIMSGYFTQRGTPAIVDKYTRAHMALLGGADLVLELPTLFATASAEHFAKEGVSLLSQTGVVDTLVYGTEESDATLISEIAKALSCLTAKDYEAIAALQKTGISFPVARANYLSAQMSDSKASLSCMTKPNNILAIEYEKALQTNQSTMRSCAIQRQGMDYHAQQGEGFASATAIRQKLLDSSDNHYICASKEAGATTSLLPAPTAFLLQSYSNKLMTENDLSALLYYKLLLHKDTGYTAFADCSQMLSDKIAKNLSAYTGFLPFVELLKSKELTYTRISRVLLHILLQHTKEDYQVYANGNHGYLRILGFKKEASPLLSAIKQNASLPIITKLADAKESLNFQSYALLEKDLFAADLYNHLSGQTTYNEYTQKFPIV